MSATGNMTLIDDYLEALLGSAPVEYGAPVIVACGAAPDVITAETSVAAVPAPVPTATPALAPAPPIPTSLAPVAQSAAAVITPVKAPPAPAIHAFHRWLRVVVGNDSYAIELLCVQEVVRLAPIVAMRGANRAVLGVMNLRGRIVPVFDLGLWLDAGHVDGDEHSRIVVIERNDELIGMLVSLVEDVVTLSRDRIEPPLPGSEPSAILGIARVGPAPTVLLDANALFG